MSARPDKTPTEKLLRNVRVTSKCRFNSAKRLENHSDFSFFTVTLLSLGLILIPLMQHNIKLNLEAYYLNAIQIFLAVATLVYSIIIEMSKYESRAEKLTICGNKLKYLSWKIDNKCSLIKEFSIEELNKFQKQYIKIILTSENHIPNDYNYARLEMKHDYQLSKTDSIVLQCKATIFSLKLYLIPTILLLLEGYFIYKIILF